MLRFSFCVFEINAHVNNGKPGSLFTAFLLLQCYTAVVFIRSWVEFDLGL